MPAMDRDPGKRLREALPEALLVGWAAVFQNHQVKPAEACGWDKCPGPQEGQERVRIGLARPFCSSKAGWWSWHFWPERKPTFWASLCGLH